MKPLSPQQLTRLQSMLTAAQKAQNTGQISRAESLYRDVLKQAPTAWDVHHQLAILLASTGNPQEAVKHFRLIVKANPTHAASHANLANALSDAGILDEAITEFNRAIALDKSLIGARIALGETLRRAKRSTEALICLRTVLDRDKSNHAAFNTLGLAYRDQEDFPRALECFEHAVGLAPKNAEYRTNFGVTLHRHKLDDLATIQFYEAVKLHPEWVEALVLLAESLQEQRRLDEAIEVLGRARQLSPNNPELIERTGYVYLEMADTNQATKAFKLVLSQYPDRFMALLGLGRTHMEAGQAREAATALELLIERHPENATGYFYLAASRKFRSDDPLIKKLQSLVDKSIVQETESCIGLSFALGKIYDDCKEWDAAFEQYARGNRLRNSKYAYLQQRQETEFDSIISVFSQEFIKNHSFLGIDSDQPVFIVGMPRSGTTLTEQIISSHPEAAGAGEVVFWTRAWESSLYSMGSNEEYPKCISMLTQDTAHKIAIKYIELLTKIAGDETSALRITDKMPHNFVHLGLIAILFPKARIIHCKRSAMDTCLSIFFQNFASDHPYAYDLRNLGHQYQQYERLMKHWQKVLPGRIFDINYEDTIANPEHWSRKLIEHIGLEWNNACLAPHKIERSVKTASHWQVRQPIYKSSVQRWKHYEKHLSALKIALGYTEEYL